MTKKNEIKFDGEVRLIRDRILVRPINDPDKTAGGIIVLDRAKDLPQLGEVVAVGTGKLENGKLRPLDVQVGDRVYFYKYTGIHFWRGKEELLFMKENEILAKEPRV